MKLGKTGNTGQTLSFSLSALSSLSFVPGSQRGEFFRPLSVIWRVRGIRSGNDKTPQGKSADIKIPASIQLPTKQDLTLINSHPLPYSSRPNKTWLSSTLIRFHTAPDQTRLDSHRLSSASIQLPIKQDLTLIASWTFECAQVDEMKCMRVCDQARETAVHFRALSFLSVYRGLVLGVYLIQHCTIRVARQTLESGDR